MSAPPDTLLARIDELEALLRQRDAEVARLEKVRRALVERSLVEGANRKKGHELFESNVLLARQVMARTRELEQANELLRAEERELKKAKEAAEAAARARSTFLTTMSHEMRTPLNGVLGMTALLMDTDLSEEQGQHLETIDTCGRTLLQLINDILDFSKLDSHGLEAESLLFDPRGVVRDVVAIVKESAAAKGLGLDVDLDPDLPPAVLGDPARLRQVLLNLAANAVKFTPEGQVLLRLSGEPLHDGRLELWCCVDDSGIGISAEAQAQLFRPFVQADASTSRRFGGTGLGLAICRQVVEGLGGEIGVESEPGVGSRFWFHVPVRPATADERDAARCSARASRAAALPASAGAKADARALHALVVEDNPVNQRVAVALLGKLGVTCDVASDGALALAALERASYDVIFMDCQMPVMDGYEASLRVREREARAGSPRTPIIALTAHAFASERQKCTDAGMDDFVSKPVSREQLATVLARWVPSLVPA